MPSGTLCGRPGWGLVPHELNPDSTRKSFRRLAQDRTLGDPEPLGAATQGAFGILRTAPTKTATRKVQPWSAPRFVFDPEIGFQLLHQAIESRTLEQGVVIRFEDMDLGAGEGAPPRSGPFAVRP